MEHQRSEPAAFESRSGEKDLASVSDAIRRAFGPRKPSPAQRKTDSAHVIHGDFASLDTCWDGSAS